MKKLLNQCPWSANCIAFLFLLAAFNTGCRKSDALPATSTTSASSLQIDAFISLDGFEQYNIVADKNIFGALLLDPKLQNAWGMAADDEGEIWVNANETGRSFVYGPNGQHLLPPVAIPSHNPAVRGKPTGTVYNNTSDFVIPGTGSPSEFLFAEEGGTVSAWNDATGSTAKVVADKTSADAVYKGLAIASIGNANFIYVTDFANAKIDVFNKNFKCVTDKSFTDPDLPKGYAPFNIRNIRGMLFVTYALQTADHEDDSAGVGFGFVDIFRPNGKLVKRFASKGTLNAPWGITEARPGYDGKNNAILIGNFGDGRINVYDPLGNFKGQLKEDGKPITIFGLWALDTDIPGVKGKRIYFTAGPNDEEDGLFGFLLKEKE